MRRMVSLLLIVSLFCGMAMFLVACGERPDGGAVDNGGEQPGDGNGSGDGDGDGEEKPRPTLVLVENGTANFRFVYSSQMKSEVIRTIDEVVSTLGEYGVTVEKQSDRDNTAQDCEILIGGSLQGRENYAVDVHTVGLEGYLIEARDSKIIVAGGSTESTVAGLRFFAEKYLYAAKEDGDRLTDCSVAQDLRIEKPTDYLIPDVTVAGKSMKSGFNLVVDDPQDPCVGPVASTVQSTFYTKAGVWMDIVNAPREGTPSVYVRAVEDCGENGFAVYEKKGDLYIECAYANSFAKGINAFFNRFINTAMEEVAFDTDFSYSYCISIVRYTDFGVVGDGTADDLDAIREAHKFANECGQKVCAYAASDETKGAGLTFYVGFHDYTVSIRTDTDWGNARFIIDDRNIDEAHRSYNVFAIERDEAPVNIDVSDFSPLKVGATNIGMTFDRPYMLYLNWSGNKVYIRYGGNANNGTNQQEVILVDAEGNIDPSTPILWDYGGMDSITAYPLDDKPITVEGGIFTTRANKGTTVYAYYARGIQISRSNATVKNVKHYITDEGPVGCPYSAFFAPYAANNIELNSCVMTGHKTYVGINANTGAKVSQGTYDTVSNRCNNVRWVDCVQSQPVDSPAFTDQSVCWGVMASNFCKNLLMEGCTLSRFDAHQGMWNATVKDSTIGIAINCIGGGTMLVENTTRCAGSSFLSLRADYGSIWEGDMIIRNCTFRTSAATAYIVSADYAAVYNDTYGTVTGHWFGYRCCMPTTLTVENFRVDTSNGSPSLYVFNRITSQSYDISKDIVNPYAFPTMVTVTSAYPIRLTDSANPYVKEIPCSFTKK